MKDSNFLHAQNARHLWHPMAHPGDMQANAPAIITSAEGVHITDVDGHRMLDSAGGLWNVNLGYSCDPVKQAMKDQLDSLPYYTIFRGTTTDVAIELSYLLQKFFAPDGLTRAFYTSGGSDSVEVALRLARQYHKLRGEAGRAKFLSLKKGYHGTHTLGASVNGNANFRSAYEPLMPGCFHTPAPYTYRNPFDETDPARLAQLCLAAIEDEIAFQGVDTIAAFIMEPILGAGGVIPPHPSFMPGVRQICDKHGILLIADEVVTAFGRTGAWSGSRLWGVKPDMMCIAKALSNGFFPIGAVMLSDQIAETFESDKSGKASIGSGYTYSGHPIGAAASIACLAETERLNVIGNASARGTQLHDGLLGLMDRHEIVGDVRGGYGLMCALELVSDRAAKTPLDKKAIKVIYETAYAKGVMLRVSGNNVILSPSLIVEDSHIDTILSAIDAGLAAT
ncbi:aminotransferase class III-fold pyridoxal phosphate-dependent enzyme [Sagittula sp. NFXS13]|uniref:aminotransferase class III-fold pyridoxal phosphate-dependent enzyme n=1 Tax=Sagittula sp. NFXS13 TaxID=2819095 RepID=UPI0032DE435A